MALLLLALQECCDDIPLPQVPDKLEDSVIVICPSTGPSSAQLSFRLSPFDCQCNLANQVSLHQFKAPVASSMIDLCSIVKEQLGPCAATGDVQFFVRGLLLSKFATLRDAHTLWTVVWAPSRTLATLLFQWPKAKIQFNNHPGFVAFLWPFTFVEPALAPAGYKITFRAPKDIHSNMRCSVFLSIWSWLESQLLNSLHPMFLKVLQRDHNTFKCTK